MKDTVAVACPVERDATWGSRWSPQDVGWLVVPRDAGWPPWRDALARQHPHIHLHIPAGTPTHPWWLHTRRPLQKVLDGGATHRISLPGSLAGSHQTRKKKKELSTERHHFPHKETFLYKEDPRHVHTDSPPPSAVVAWRQFITSYTNLPEAPSVQTLPTCKFARPSADPVCWESVTSCRWFSVQNT